MKASDVRIIIWACVTVVVLALLIVLFVQPTWLNLDFASIGFGGITAYVYENASSYTSGNAEFDADEIKSLNIEWISGDVEIVTADTDKVTITETTGSVLPEKESVHWYLDNGTLRIRFAASGVTVINKTKSLHITVPEGFSMEEVDIDAVSAKIKAAGFDTEKFDIESVSGSITLDSIKGGNVEIQTVSGSIALSSIEGDKLNFETISGSIDGTELTFNVIDGDTTSGKTIISFADSFCPKEAEFDSVSGSVTLILSEECPFKARVSGVSGHISTDFACVIEDSTYICGDGGFKINLDTVSGDLSINKK